MTPWDCGGGEYTDVDQDGLGDYCEVVIAEAFAPKMKFAPSDDVRRQSYWAARPLGDGRIRIFYALAYYVDLGVSEGYTGCKFASFGELLADCDGHPGDSEAIVLDVWFNGASDHWLLDGAKLSYHGNYNVYSRGSNYYPTALSYNRRLGADPNVYVAKWKHSNYRNDSDCDAGNGGGQVIQWVFQFDDCPGNTSSYIVDAFGNRNLGSNVVRLIDCVMSVDPYYQDPVHPSECFWSAAHFYGWQLDQTTGDDPAGYGGLLRAQGF